MFAAKRGPGAMTPDAEITITNTANSRIWTIVFWYSYFLVMK
jgi:hypothetical protein